MAAEAAEVAEATQVEDGEDLGENNGQNGVSLTPQGEGDNSDVSIITRAVRNMSAGTDDLRVSADHVALMNAAIDRLCKRSTNLTHIPRAGEAAGIDAYARIVRKAISDGENDSQILEKLVAAGVQEDQANAAVTALRVRMDEVRWVLCSLPTSSILQGEVIARMRRS
jgi:hypothetical protein